jgi:hypothetical protein
MPRFFWTFIIRTAIEIENIIDSNSMDDLNALNKETLMKLEELKESVPAQAIKTVSDGRLATKKPLTGRIPEFFSSLDPTPSIIRLRQ